MDAVQTPVEGRYHLNIHQTFLIFFAGVGLIVFSPIMIIFTDTINAFTVSSTLKRQNYMVGLIREYSYELADEMSKGALILSNGDDQVDVKDLGAWRTARMSSEVKYDSLVEEVSKLSSSQMESLALVDIRDARNTLEMINAKIENNEYVHIDTFLETHKDLNSALNLLQSDIIQPQNPGQFAIQQILQVQLSAQMLFDVTSQEGVFILRMLKEHGQIEEGTLQKLAVLRDTAQEKREYLALQIEKMSQKRHYTSRDNAFKLFTALQSLEDRFLELDQMRRKIYAASLLGVEFPVTYEEWQDQLKKTLRAAEDVERVVASPSQSALGNNLKDLIQRLMIISAAGFIAVAILYILFLLLKVRILKPVDMITQQMTGLAAGDLHLDLPETHRMDEVAEMIEALKIFQQTAVNARRLASIPERNPDPIIELNENGMITYMNQAAQKEFPNMYMVDGTVHPIFKDFFDLQIEGMRQNVSSLLQIKQVNDKYYERYTTFVGLQNKMLVRVFLRDITDKRNQEMALQDSQQRAEAFMNALEASKTGLVILKHKDGKHTVDYMNNSFSKITGYQVEDFLSQNFEFLAGEQTDKLTLSGIKSAVDKSLSISREILCHKKDEQTFWARMHLAPIRDASGAAVKYSLILEDISEEKLRQENAKKQQNLVSVGEMAGGMAHEINNALQPILGLSEALNTQFLKDEKFKDKQQLTQVIYEYALFAKNIVTDMLAFTRQDSTTLEDIKIQDVIHHNIPLLKDNMPSGVTLEAEDLILGSDDADEMVRINKTGFFQILTNLVRNACHAMNEEGQITITSRTEMLEQGNSYHMAAGRYLLMDIADTGCGMDERTKAKIFEPFFSTKDVGKGTGLGLSVVFGILKSWNGGITVDSKVGEGTTFTLLIPILQKRSESDQPI